MAKTPSNMLPLGTVAPDFKLTNTIDDKQVHLRDYKGTEGTVIMFICNHCPFVIQVLVFLFAPNSLILQNNLVGKLKS